LELPIETVGEDPGDVLMPALPPYGLLPHAAVTSAAAIDTAMVKNARFMRPNRRRRYIAGQ
jgi:hypothetical protein